MALGTYSVIYEDDALFVVDKPSGMLVIPTPRSETDTLTDLVNRDLDARKILVNAYPCHRLDRDTSGIVVYAKGKKVQKLMMEAFQAREVKKEYIALVQGCVKNDAGTVRKEILNKNRNRIEPAMTNYKVLERRKGYTLLQLEPVTGRTNQIRIHMKTIGHPILGEEVFAFRKDFDRKAKRLMLHARKIAFPHPVTKEPVVIEAPVPQEFEQPF